MTQDELAQIFTARYPQWVKLVRWLNQDDDPDDIIQTAMVGVLRDLAKVQSPGYIHQRIVWAAKWRRREDGRMAHNFDKAWVPLFADEDRDQSLACYPMARLEQSLDCATLLQRAHPKERALLIAHYIGGVSHADLAQAQGTTTQYIKSRLSCIRARLRSVERGNGPRRYAVAS
jgi:RNA polymerase sigma factor (sigma-70 family)